MSYDNDDYRTNSLPRKIHIVNAAKKICVINSKGIVMRVTRSTANDMMKEDNTWKYTSKSKLRSFLNQQGKLNRNKVAIRMFGTRGGYKDLLNLKSYARVCTYKFLLIFSKKHKGKLNQKDFLKRLIELPVENQIHETGVKNVITSYE